jgi:hypothetical protein
MARNAKLRNTKLIFASIRSYFEGIKIIKPCKSGRRIKEQRDYRYQNL